MSDQITAEQVRHIAHLARLKLTDEELSRFGSQLASIVEYVQKLGEANTDGVEPTAHPLPVTNIFRDDSPATSLSPDMALNNAPSSDPPYFKVPKVLDQETA